MLTFMELCQDLASRCCCGAVNIYRAWQPGCHAMYVILLLWAESPTTTGVKSWCEDATCCNNVNGAVGAAGVREEFSGSSPGSSFLVDEDIQAPESKSTNLHHLYIFFSWMHALQVQWVMVDVNNHAAETGRCAPQAVCIFFWLIWHVTC